jgi:DNA end-binding protein Ku
MPRKLQSANISFGLVSILTSLYTATSSEQVSFHQIHAKCGSRIKQQIFCPVCKVVVDRSELVKGYELAEGRHVTVTQDELEKVEASTSQSIDILQFVPLQTVDPIYFENTYYLGPAKGGEKPYRLLAHAMEKTQRVALAKFVMRGKENLVLIRAGRGGLILHTMYYADEVRDFGEIEKGQATTTEAELNLAMRLIDELSETAFHPEEFHDEYRERLLEMINRKAEGKQVAVEPQAKPAAVVDLMEALKASLEKGARKARPAAKPARAEVSAKRAPAGRR